MKHKHKYPQQYGLQAPTTNQSGYGRAMRYVGGPPPTTVSITPPRGQSGIQPYVQGHHIPLPQTIAQDPYRYQYAEEEFRAPTKVVTPPLQYGKGIDDESMDYDEETDTESDAEDEIYSKGRFLGFGVIYVVSFRQNKYDKSSSQSPLYKPG